MEKLEKENRELLIENARLKGQVEAYEKSLDGVKEVATDMSRYIPLLDILNNMVASLPSCAPLKYLTG